MTNKADCSYDETFRRCILINLYLIISAYLIAIFIYPLTSVVQYFLFGGIVLNVVSVVISYMIPVYLLRKLTLVYIIILQITLVPSTIFLLSNGIATTMFWFQLIPIFLYTVFPEKQILKLLLIHIGFVMFLFALVIIIRNTVYDTPIVTREPADIMIFLRTDILNVMISLLLIVNNMYHIQKMYLIKCLEVKCEKPKCKTNRMEDMVEVEKFESFYKQIEEYFETKQPYLNMDFKIGQMSSDLNINAVYLTRAIRDVKKTNFSNLVNLYRIQRVKELIHDDSHKYTLEYIYLSAGFSSQTSFNRAFKQHLGITPSEYCKRNSAIEN